ncbi:hypothetical protein [Rhabdothermincola salaria]|uniref:hypothetical protein n=1 Tax=Rhabdothermincola salaria TaxID=2903142 RepID=UPI001E652039|nr:hypothetical protein [Rhabdothermincola salaria]MCD9623061.1 hypothetical protein [Rhabdothermincola salaria]
MPLLDTARRLGLTRGVFGDSRPWLVIGGLAWGLRALQWARRPSPETVMREVLEPGETIVIRHDGAPPTRRQRRKAAKAVKKASRRAERSDAEATAATLDAVTGHGG